MHPLPELPPASLPLLCGAGLVVIVGTIKLFIHATISRQVEIKDLFDPEATIARSDLFSPSGIRREILEGVSCMTAGKQQAQGRDHHLEPWTMQGADTPQPVAMERPTMPDMETRPDLCPFCGNAPNGDYHSEQTEGGRIYFCPTCENVLYVQADAVRHHYSHQTYFISSDDTFVPPDHRVREEIMRRTPLPHTLSQDAEGQVVGLFNDLVDKFA